MSVKNSRYSIAVIAAKAIAIIAGLVVATYAVSASAAPNEHYTAFGWHATKFTVRPFSDPVHPSWNAALLSATQTWNKANPEVQITLDENSLNTVQFVNEFFANDGRQAEYKKICLPAGCWFEISINAEHLELNPKEVRLLGEFLILHELGHALGLNDFEPTSLSNSSVMAHYEKPHKKPELHPYDKHLVAERIRLMKRSPHQLIPTLTLGVLRPAAEWVVATVETESSKEHIEPATE